MFLEIPEMHELAMASRSSPGRVEARRGELVASGYSSFWLELAIHSPGRVSAVWTVIFEIENDDLWLT